MKLSTLLYSIVLACACASAADAQPRWIASWAAAPQDYLLAPVQSSPAPPPGSPTPSLVGQTLRLRLQPSVGGQRLRIRFSNLFGKVPMRIVSASVARSTGVDAVSPGTLQRLSFAGRRDVTLAPGEEGWSDAAPLAVEAGQTVAVSFHLNAKEVFATVHHLPSEGTSIVTGDAVTQTRWRHAATSYWNHVVTGVDVEAAGTPRVVVAFGDSITEGAGTDDTLAARYPSKLATRLRSMPGARDPVAVINAGIGGNRLLADNIGPRGLGRFARDALGQSGVTHVAILIGINDVAFGPPPGAPPDLMPGFVAPTAEQITQGLEALIEEAQARGVKVMMGTLTPFKGSVLWNEDKEARRQAVNRWIRGRQDVEAVVDFDRALRNPADAAALNPIYDVGDHLHPNALGCGAMAEAFDLRELRK